MDLVGFEKNSAEKDIWSKRDRSWEEKKRTE
jgi:hypothetical protein